MSWLSKIVNKPETWFKTHKGAIVTAITDATAAAGVAGEVASALGEPSSVTSEIGRVADGLSKVGGAVSEATSSSDLSAQASVAANLVTGLVNSGDIGVKSDKSKAHVDNVISKVQNVADVLNKAAADAPGAGS